ncbi:MAG: hypothetical protein ACYC4R_05130 [Anaerolineae bacterium]
MTQVPRRRSYSRMQRAIHKRQALRLCSDMRARNRCRWHGLPNWLCWGCTHFAKGDPARMCGGVVGCTQVLARHRRRSERVH